MRMEEIRFDAPRRPYEAGQQRRDEQGEPWAPAEVSEHAVPVCQPVAGELFGADDLDVDAAPADMLDGVGDETTDDVARKARVRGRENGDSDADL
jgi:hypothetical protein